MRPFISMHLNGKNFRFISLLSEGTFALGLLVLIVMVPLGVRLYPLTPAPDSFATYVHGQRLFDFYHGFKSQLLVAAAALMSMSVVGFSLVALGTCPQKQVSLKSLLFKSQPMLLGLLWFAVAIYSQWFGKYRDLVWRGGLTQFDGLGTTLAFGTLLFVGYWCGGLTGREGHRLRAYFAASLFAVTVIIAALGFIELQGFSLIRVPWVLDLIVPDIFEKEIKVEQLYLGGMAVTFGNPNYTAFFGAMVLPFWASQILFMPSSRQPVMSKLIYICALFSASAVAFGSSGIAGSFGWLFALLLLFTLFIRAFHIKYMTNLLILSSAFLLSFWATAGIGGGIWSGFVLKSDQVARLANQVSVMVQDFFKGKALPPKSPEPSLYTLGDRLVLENWPPGLMLEKTIDGLRLMDLSYRPIPVEASDDMKDKDTYLALDSRFAGLTVKRLNHQAFYQMGIQAYELQREQESLIVGDTPKGLRILTNQSFIKPIRGRSLNLPVDESLLSHRIFIWLRVLPLVLDRPWLGHGSGGFMIDFPNRDVAAMVSRFGPHVYLDRPHSIYFQSLYQSGLIGTVLFVLLLGHAIYQGSSYWFWRVQWATSSPISRQESMLLALAAGLLGASGAGLGYDLCVGYGGTFWFMLGLVIGLASTLNMQKRSNHHPNT